MLKILCAILLPALSLWPVRVEITSTIKIMIMMSNAHKISDVNLNKALKKFNILVV